MNNNDEIKKRLKIFLKDDNLVDEFLGINGYNLDIKLINKFKLQIKEKLESPLYEIKLICPICKTKLKGFEIKSKALITNFNWLYVPFFKPVAKTKQLDYNQYSISVCPNCLFASHTKFDFERVSSYSSNIEKSVVTNTILTDLNLSKSKRLDIINYKDEIKKDFDKFPRSYETSILSYKLAIEKTDSEIKNLIKNAHFKKANYLLRLVKLYLKSNSPEEETNNTLLEALKNFKEAFKLSNFSKFEDELKNIFQLTSLLLFLDKDKEAYEYRNFMKKIIDESSEDDKPKAIKWEKSFNRLMENKDFAKDFNNIME